MGDSFIDGYGALFFLKNRLLGYVHRTPPRFEKQNAPLGLLEGAIFCEKFLRAETSCHSYVVTFWLRFGKVLLFCCKNTSWQSFQPPCAKNTICKFSLVRERPLICQYSLPWSVIIPRGPALTLGPLFLVWPVCLKN